MSRERVNTYVVYSPNIQFPDLIGEQKGLFISNSTTELNKNSCLAIPVTVAKEGKYSVRLQLPLTGTTDTLLLSDFGYVFTGVDTLKLYPQNLNAISDTGYFESFSDIDDAAILYMKWDTVTVPIAIRTGVQLTSNNLFTYELESTTHQDLTNAHIALTDTVVTITNIGTTAYSLHLQFPLYKNKTLSKELALPEDKISLSATQAPAITLTADQSTASSNLSITVNYYDPTTGFIMLSLSGTLYNVNTSESVPFDNWTIATTITQ